MKKFLVFLSLLFVAGFSSAKTAKLPNPNDRVIKKSITKNLGVVTFFKLDMSIVEKFGLDKGKKGNCGSVEFGWALQYNCILYGSIVTSCDGSAMFIHDRNEGLDMCFGNEEMIC